MSGIKELTEIIYNPIKYSKSWHSFSNPSTNSQKYFFELFINYNGEKKIFRKIEDNKKTNLININHEIKFSNIKDFTLSISALPSEFNFIKTNNLFNTELLIKAASKKIDLCKMNGIINQNQSSYTQNNEESLIEFSQNSNGYTICNCFYLGIDNLQMCISPPN